jgi:hypothetical protein
MRVSRGCWRWQKQRCAWGCQAVRGAEGAVVAGRVRVRVRAQAGVAAEAEQRQSRGKGKQKQRQMQRHSQRFLQQAAWRIYLLLRSAHH